MKRIKRITLWIVVSILMLTALITIPSISCIAALAIALLIAPIEKLQNTLQKVFKGKAKTVSIIILVVLLLLAFPSADLSNDDVNGSIPTNPTASSTIFSSTSPISPTTTPHTHVFSNATCTSPRTCSCGITEGTAEGHTWVDATCTDPKTCTTCGDTEGSAHGHDWIDATCTDPKTCTTCGDTEGSAHGHDWQKATCLSPKNCTTCGETIGNVSQHTYSNGQCTVCDAYKMVWIPTNGGEKYHSSPSCSNMKNPEQVTQKEAESRGFTPCSRCH